MSASTPITLRTPLKHKLPGLMKQDSLLIFQTLAKLSTSPCRLDIKNKTKRSRNLSRDRAWSDTPRTVSSQSTCGKSSTLLKKTYLPLYKPALVRTPTTVTPTRAASPSAWDDSDSDEPEPLGLDGIRRCCNCRCAISTSAEIYACHDGRQRWFCVSCPSPRRSRDRPISPLSTAPTQAMARVLIPTKRYPTREHKRCGDFGHSTRKLDPELTKKL
eukprot:m.48895 g.48895  ORF g.48895 m.48895 type:complete len:216 (+) comp20880_c1_seq1:322-969(+)